MNAPKEVGDRVKSYKDIFDAVSGIGYIAHDPALSNTQEIAPQQDIDASKSFWSRVAPNMSTSVSATAVSAHKMDTNKAVSCSQLQQNIGAVSSVAQDARAMQGQIMGACQEMQRELMAATKAAGCEFFEVFPDYRDSANGEFGIACSLAIESTGIQALKQVSNVSMVQDIVAGAKSGSIDPKAALAQIHEKMCTMSSPSHAAVPDYGGTEQNAVVPLPKSRFDYTQMSLDEVEMLAYLNPENMADNIPEYAQALDLEQRANVVLEDLMGIDRDAKEHLFGDIQMRENSLYDTRGPIEVAAQFVPAVNDPVYEQVARLSRPESKPQMPVISPNELIA